MRISGVGTVNNNYKTANVRFGEVTSGGRCGNYKSLLDESESDVPVERLPIHNYECLDIALRLLKINQKEIEELKEKVAALERRPVYRREMPCGPMW